MLNVNLLLLRAFARYVRLVSPKIQTATPFEHLVGVHTELVQDGGMNWGRMLSFIRYAQEYPLSNQEWEDLYGFLRNHYHYSDIIHTSVSAILN